MSKNELQRHNYCQEAISLKNDIESHFLDLAERLYRIKEFSLWQGVYGSWEDFTVELKMSSSNINRLIQVHQTFVVDYGIPQKSLKRAGGFSHLSEILPVIHSKKEALQWLVKAQTLSRPDLRKELMEEKTGLPMANCKHKDTYTVEICRDCGERIKKI